MNIKYSKHKQEIREDPVLDFLSQVRAFVKARSNGIIVVAVAIIAVVGFSIIYSQMRGSSLAKAQDAFGKAMIEFEGGNLDQAVELFRVVADNHRQTPQAGLSSYMLGSIYLRQGRNDEAITWFEVASRVRSSSFVAGQALEGIAAAYEAKGDVTRAIEYFGKALQDKRIAHRHTAIRWKLALLTMSADAGRAKALCREIIADTTAMEYRQRAENLLATIDAVSAG